MRTVTVGVQTVFLCPIFSNCKLMPFAPTSIENRFCLKFKLTPASVVIVFTLPLFVPDAPILAKQRPTLSSTME